MKFMVSAVSRDINGRVTDVADTWPLNATSVEDAKAEVDRQHWREPRGRRKRLRDYGRIRQCAYLAALSQGRQVSFVVPEQWAGSRGSRSSRILCARAPKEELSPFLIQDPERIGCLGQVQRCEERLGPDFHLIQVGGHVCDPIQSGMSIITFANADEFDDERHVPVSS
jgi:hypothetical protein